MSKQLVLMRDLICKHHPEFVNTPALRRYGLKHSSIFNVERLVEECLAKVGRYKFIDAAHADFSDGSDSKTASIREAPQRLDSISHIGQITNVVTAAGGFKAGALRCTVYNPHQDRLDYYFLPRAVWSEMVTYNATSGIGKISYNYNRVSDRIPKLADWQCDSFEQMARKRNR